jgi:hypothetical protein
MGWLARSPLMHVLAHAIYPITGLPGFAEEGSQIDWPHPEDRFSFVVSPTAAVHPPRSTSTTSGIATINTPWGIVGS